MMEENKPLDSAEYITLEEAKRLKLPYFEGLAAGFPSPAIDYQHESLDLNDKFVHHPEASYFVRVRGESMIGLGILKVYFLMCHIEISAVYNGLFLFKLQYVF